MQETQETWVQALGLDDPLEKEMATHSNILAWEIAWTEEPDGLLSRGSLKTWTRLSNWARKLLKSPFKSVKEEKKTVIAREEREAP